MSRQIQVRQQRTNKSGFAISTINIHGRKQISIRCKMIEHWVNLRCVGYAPLAQYNNNNILFYSANIQFNNNLFSALYRYIDLPSTYRIQTHNSHSHNTTPPFLTLVQSPTYSPPKPATIPQPNTSNTPLVSTGLVKPNLVICNSISAPTFTKVHFYY